MKQFVVFIGATPPFVGQIVTVLADDLQDAQRLAGFLIDAIPENARDHHSIYDVKPLDGMNLSVEGTGYDD